MARRLRDVSTTGSLLTDPFSGHNMRSVNEVNRRSPSSHASDLISAILSFHL
jgi:hypothetical protein